MDTITERMEIVWPALALIVATIAVVAAAISGTPQTIGIALATLLVAMASVYLYVSAYPRRRHGEPPIEDFSWWTDVGEPLSTLRRGGINPMAVPSAVLSDLRPIGTNVELLFQRFRLIVGRRDFLDMPSGELMTEMDTVRSFLRVMIQRIERKMEVDPNLHEMLADLASRMGKIHERLSSYAQTKPDILRTYLDPLVRAAARLAKDFETASANYQAFVKPVQGEGSQQ